jgi:glycosyltransferase involved in cell wall biosynthesis
MTAPAISVIVPAFQMASFLEDAVRSIARQRPCATEVIIVNAGSTDDTSGVARRLARDGAPIRLIEIDRCPPGAARNVGLSSATGDLIGFLDADDVWPTNKFAQQAAYFEANPTVFAVSGFITYFDQLNRETLVPASTARVETAFAVNLGAWLYRRSVFESIGRFDESFHYSEDVDLFMRIREHDVPFKILRDVTLYYRRHSNSMMSTTNPRKYADFRMAIARSLARRRAQVADPANLESLQAFLVPQG